MASLPLPAIGPDDGPEAILSALTDWFGRVGPSESLLTWAARVARSHGVDIEVAAPALAASARKTGMHVNRRSPLLTRPYR